MAVWTIDGVIEEVRPKRTKGKHTLYDGIRLRQRDGTERALGKLSAVGEVAEALQPGASGRFYLTKTVDQTGIHGVRLDDGRSAWAYFVNVKLVVILLAINVAIVIGGLFLGKIFGLCVIISLLLGVGLFFYWQARGEGRRQFEADGAIGREPAASLAP